MTDAPLGPQLTLERTSRYFGALCAVDQVSISLDPGRVHAIIGENGAGKSTAMKMLAGHLAPSSGRVLVDGSALSPCTSREAMARGIGMVHQHFMLVDALSALHNLVLGCEPCDAFGRLDMVAALDRARELSDRTRLTLDWTMPTEQLAVGERQRLEILRVLYRGARAILLDEPTAVLSPIEAEDLYGMLHALAEQGHTIAVVTHRLDEVVRHADDVSVLRHGALVLSEVLCPLGSAERRGPSGAGLSEKLARAVMGGEPPKPATTAAVAADAPEVLELRDLVATHSDGRPALRGVSLTLRAGEVVGVAGVEGNGQTEIARALAGLLPLEAGQVRVGSEALFESEPSSIRGGLDRSSRVARARSVGLWVVHEDRHRDELLLGATVADNLVLGDLGMRDEQHHMRARLGSFDIHPSDPLHLASELSGGNQQKLVMARAIDRPLVALLLAQPTRGVDIGTARSIHHAIAKLAATGTAVLILSADLAELRALSHRIVVLRGGKLVAELPPNASDEQIGRAMLGVEAA